MDKINYDRQEEKDLTILRQLYFENHLNDNEIERASKILYLLNIELKNRLKLLK